MKKKLIIGIFLILIILAALFVYLKWFVYPLDKEGMVNPPQSSGQQGSTVSGSQDPAGHGGSADSVQDPDGSFYVDYNEFMFHCEGNQHRFLPGDTVHLSFPMIATDTDYSFFADGAEDYKVDYSDQEGYIIEFKMPENDVTVGYTEKNSMEYVPPETVITLSESENPSTGFIWEYSVDPEDILVLYRNYYESDEEDSDYPMTGVGGTHYWAFEFLEEGEAVITMAERRGSEIGRCMDYYYFCDGYNVELIEVIDRRDIDQCWETDGTDNQGYVNLNEKNYYQVGFREDYPEAEPDELLGNLSEFRSNYDDIAVRGQLYSVKGDDRTLILELSNGISAVLQRRSAR